MTAAFLVVAGYSNTQITPVMRLLGTVAGYVLGKETPREAGVKVSLRGEGSGPPGTRL